MDAPDLGRTDAGLPPSAPPVGPAPEPPVTAPPTAPASPGAPAGLPVPMDADPGAAAPPSGLWQQMKADPEYAPEHLALEAVRRLGPQAHDWAQRTWAQYPGIDPDSMARLAIRKFTTHARLSGAAAGVAGLPGAVIDTGVLAWTQARMILHIAAAYGVDPRLPERATDLLVLQKVHKVAETARTALAVAAGHEKAGVLLQGVGAGQAAVGQVLAQLGWRLAKMAGVRAAKRMFAKVIPGASIILGTWANSSATKDLARRTVATYRKGA